MNPLNPLIPQRPNGGNDPSSPNGGYDPSRPNGGYDPSRPNGRHDPSKPSSGYDPTLNGQGVPNGNGQRPDLGKETSTCTISTHTFNR